MLKKEKKRAAEALSRPTAGEGAAVPAGGATVPEDGAGVVNGHHTAGEMVCAKVASYRTAAAVAAAEEGHH